MEGHELLTHCSISCCLCLKDSLGLGIVLVGGCDCSSCSRWRCIKRRNQILEAATSSHPRMCYLHAKTALTPPHPLTGRIHTAPMALSAPARVGPACCIMACCSSRPILCLRLRGMGALRRGTSLHAESWGEQGGKIHANEESANDRGGHAWRAHSLVPMQTSAANIVQDGSNRMHQKVWRDLMQVTQRRYACMILVLKGSWF